MADQGVKLLGTWASPYSRRAEIALKLKGIEYEFVAQSLSPKSADVVKYNPIHKKVPILLHNGKPVVESLVVVEYIDETWRSGPSILPADPLEKANARFWAKFIDDKLMPAVMTIRRCQGEEQVKAIDEVVELFKLLENELNGKKFFGGDNIGLVDITANFIALWLGIHQEIMGIQIVTKEKLPIFCKWVDEYLNNSVIKQSLPSRDELSAALHAAYSKP